MKTLISHLGSLSLLIHLAAAPVVAETSAAGPAAGMELLSGIAYWSGSQVQVLMLSRPRVPTVPLKEAKESPRDPFTVLSEQPGLYEGTPLVLVESTLEAGPEKTLWRGRAKELKFQTIEAWFDADVVRDAVTGAIYVVVLQGEPGSLELRVFPVARPSSNTSLDTVPETLVPRAKFLISLWSDEFCDSRELDVSSDRAGLLLTMKATDSKCRQIGYRFDPESDTWTQVSLKRVEPSKPKEKNGNG
ncbi:MAG TPA: hypothetical protein VH394_25750 [Thermoanaerobaculia bacterium]|nr:hypothetical protein [Thermoanaerobaculia bacterium]